MLDQVKDWVAFRLLDESGGGSKQSW